MELPYKTAVSGYFEFPTDNARRLLPAHLEPVELHHGSSVLSLMVVDVTQSPIGAHRQVILSVVVAPRIDAAAIVPKIAFYPYRVGTTLAAAGQLAAQLWRLPHWSEDLKIDLLEQDKALTAKVGTGSDPIAELTVTEYAWEPVKYLYQCFTKDASGAYVANVRVTGQLSEHEEEGGKVTLHDHPFNAGVMIGDVYDVPFREAWMRDGTQAFEPLVQLQKV